MILDIFGGFLIIVWMIGLFLTIIWLVLPFVIFTIKLRCDEICSKLASIESRLTDIETSMDTQTGNCNPRDDAGASALAKPDVLQ